MLYSSLGVKLMNMLEIQKVEKFNIEFEQLIFPFDQPPPYLKD